jgi:4-amino-4-deoxy-L-arabinose transferase-like glycosyltransferase
LKTALPLSLIVALAALARTWQLSQNEFGRQYYAAGVRSMLDSWHNFLFNAFDPAGFVSIDKPPVAIWLQAASAKLLGFSALSILLAQVIAGLAAILIIYILVQKYWGRTAGAVAALSLALSPVNVAVDRSNNTESCLILVLLVGAWLGMRAAETGRLALLCAAMAAIGVGFNVKMGAALVLAPVLALTFSLARPGAPVTWHLGRQVIAGFVLIAVSLSWAIFYDLTPARDRPYAGSTRHNSMLELALVHNGAARFLATPSSPTNSAAVSGETAPASAAVRPQPVMTDDSPTGPLRLFRPRAAAQFAWLLPLALAGLVLAWSEASGPGAPASRRISAAIWSGWLVMYWIVLSFAGGLIHTYYVAVLGPPLAVFSGIAVAGLWSRWQAGKPYLPLIIVATAVWQAYLCIAPSETIGSDWLSLTWLTSIGIATIGAAGLYLFPPQNRLSKLFAVAAIGALLVPPSLTAASVVLRRPNIAAPVASMTALLTPPDSERAALRASRLEAARQKLTSYLIANREAANFLVAVPNANVAAPLIISTGLPIMAMGGYLGDDPILTPSDIERLATDRQLRFVMLGGFTLAPAKQAAALEPVARWVRANGRLVDSRLWRLSGASGSTPYRINLGNEWVEVPPPELFDLWGKAN